VKRRRPVTLPAGLRPEDLPEWMRSGQKETDFLWLGVLLLAFALSAPLWARSGLPPTLEMQQQLVRTLEMSHSLQDGVIYPRWAPDFNSGYGSPLWNYLPPLPHWLTGFYHALVQSDPSTAVKAVITLGIMVGVVSLFAFARRRWGTYAGLLAALGYSLCPAVMWDVPFATGGVGALLAAGMFLLALWSYDVLMTTGHRRDLVFATLVTSALWLSHAPLNIWLALLLLGWVIWHCWAAGRTTYAAYRAALAWLLGLMLSSFYLLPAILEHDLIRWQAAIVWPLADWQPLSLTRLLAPPSRPDLSAANPPATNAIGVALWGTAFLSLGVCFYQDWRRTPGPAAWVSRGEAWQARLAALPRHMPAAHREMLYFVLVGLLTCALVTPLAETLWGHVPAWLSAYPRDLLPAICAMCALVTAQIGPSLQQLRSQRIALAGMLVLGGLLLMAALPLRIEPRWPTSRTPTSVADILRDEGRGYLAGSFADGWLLPSDLAAVPQPLPSLLASYQGGFTDRVIRERLPAATQADVIESGPQTQRLIVNARRPATLVLALLYFPGWKATVDGREVDIHRDPQTGFVSLDVPVGRHEVRVEFGSTPARDVGWAMSALALASLVGIVLWRKPPLLEAVPRAVLAIDTERLLHTWVLSGFSVSVALVVALMPLIPGWPVRESPPGVVEGATGFPRAFQGGIDLLAFNLDAAQPLHPGDRIALHLYWRAVQPDLPDYQVEIELISGADESATVWPIVQHRHPAGIPTSRWTWWPLLRTYVRDSYYLRLPRALPAGTYRIAVRLESCNLTSIAPCGTGTPLFVYDGRGTSLGTQAILPITLRVLAD